MPELRPFRALRYDISPADDAARLLCPPYDVISPSERERLAARDPRNAVHVELPQDETGRPAYEQAARLWSQWQADGTLRRDARPAIYGYEQRYVVADAERATARGFFCLLRLQPFEPGGEVRAHERTMAGPKEDRYRLIRAVKANLSPVLLLYETSDDGASSASLLDELLSGPPTVQASAQDGLGQRLWAVDGERSAAQRLLELAASRPLTVADGHHRYETALRYLDEMRDGLTDDPERSGTAAADWVLVLLFDAASGGLSVLPTHRLVFSEREPRDLLAAVERFFRPTSLAGPDVLHAELARPGRLGLVCAAGCFLLEPRPQRVEPLLPAGASEALRWLDVTVLTSALPALVGEEPQALLEAGRLEYIKDLAEVLARSATSRGGYAFLLPPTPVQAVLQVAAAGEQMPHKSTYFEPKPATGLVFNPLTP